MDESSYIQLNKDLYSHLIEYIESEDDPDIIIQELINYLNSRCDFQNIDEFKEFLQIIGKISNQHSRKNNFYDKIKKILLNYKPKIEESLTNQEKYQIFKKNRLILLFLLENKMIKFDKTIVRLIIQKVGSKDNRYLSYFYPELKPFLKKETNERIQKQLIELDSNIFDNFDENRRIGENHSYLCNLIRNDNVEDFIIYYTKNNMSSSNLISNSIFETNTLLIKTKPLLIEYAAFFGSIQIIRFLQMNGSELPSTLWFYAIHGRNPELIHFLEENKIFPKDKTFESCLNEAIKCHHNDFADYILDNLLNKNVESKDINQFFIHNIAAYGFKYHNYNYIQEKIENQFLYFYSCFYNYFELVKILTEKYNMNPNQRISIFIYLFNYKISFLF